jgi:hypothetical protein
LKGLLRRIETAENELNRLLNKKVVQVGSREFSGKAKSNEIQAYKLSII